MPTVISPVEVSNLLRKSIKWVYANAHQLGAAKIGGSIIFTREGLEYALACGKQVDRPGNGGRPQALKARISNKDSGKRVGGRNTQGPAESAIISEARNLGIID